MNPSETDDYKDKIIEFEDIIVDLEDITVELEATLVTDQIIRMPTADDALNAKRMNV